MKKFISLVLALLMTISAASIVGAAEEPAIAADTTATEDAVLAQYEEAIQFLAEYGIYHGKSATDLAAADPIERYQMALFVARLSTGWVDDELWGIGSQYYVAAEWYDHDHDTSGFDDVIGTPAANYLGALSYASQKGIILGYGNRKFGPTDGITYQDALTMVCRTLGYKDLKWPWGFIEKAVTLELTKGIPSSVKYTDKLNRGEVAQIIYNALFAPTKEGDTLAARNFNGELGWETIIVTIAGRGRFIAGEQVDGDKNPTDFGNVIGFRVVDAVTGEIGDKTYYVYNDDTVSFKFENHKERFLGYAYKALFTKDENSDYVTMISLKSVKNDEVWNKGLLTKGDDGKYPIASYLSGKTLVSKFTKNTYLNSTNGEYGIKQFIVKNALQSDTITVDAGRKYAIDWTSGNILKVNTDDKGAYKASFSEGGTDYTFTYDIEWYYNSILNQYFKFKKVDQNGKIEFVGIDWLDPAEVDSLIANSRLTKEAKTRSGLKTLTSGVGNTAYASLISFTIPGYEKSAPNYGLYEEYRFGQYTEDKDGDGREAYKIIDLDAVAKPSYEELNPGKTYENKGILVAKEGTGGGYASRGFISEDSVATPVKGDYIIYSYDDGTGEIKVVKIIYDKKDAKADDKNFVTTGVVRAYNVPNHTVTIDGTQYSYDYNDLLGNPFYYSGRTNITWEPIYSAAFTRYFKSLFNQYVNYVVVDGKLVWVERANPSAEMIVVDSYAGLSSDGYIVVNGYSTKDLTYAQFRVGSYDGWVKGDYYYYLDDAKVEQSFKRGSLYRITSYDKDKDVYYVATVFHYFDRVNGYLNLEYWLDQLVADGVVEKISLEIRNGYRTFDNTKAADKIEWTKTSSKDKYVLICNPIDNFYSGEAKGAETTVPTPTYDDVIGGVGGGDYAPIIVYTGAGKNGWTLTGYRVKGTDAIVVIGIDYLDLGNGVDEYYWGADQWQINYVLFLHYDYETANYNGADSTGWYLLGASEYTARVFNFYNGNIEVKNATNKNLIFGYTYPAIGDWIVNDAPYVYQRLDIAVPAAYQSGKIYQFWQGMLGDYVNGTYLAKTAAFSDDGDTWKAELKKMFDTDTFSKKILSKINPKFAAAGQEIKGLTTGVKWFWVTTGANGKIAEVERIERDAFRTWIMDNKVILADLYFWVVQKVDGATVVYIEKSANTAGTYTRTPAGYIKNIMSSKDVEDLADIEITTEITGTTKNGIPVTASLKGFGFEWVGTPTYDTHEAVDLDDFHFGRYGNCNHEDWDTRIYSLDAMSGTKLYGSIDAKNYDPHKIDDTECDLVKKVNVIGQSTNYTVKLPAQTNTPDSVDTVFYVRFTDSNLVVYTFKVVVTATNVITNGKLTDVKFTVNTIAKDYVLGSTDINYDQLTPANVGLVMDISRNVLATNNGEFHAGDYPDWVDWYVDHDGVNGYGPIAMTINESTFPFAILSTQFKTETIFVDTPTTITAFLAPDFVAGYPVDWTIKTIKAVDPTKPIAEFKDDEIRSLTIIPKNGGIVLATANCGDHEVSVIIVIGDVTIKVAPTVKDLMWTGETQTLTATVYLEDVDFTADLAEFIDWDWEFTDPTDPTLYVSVVPDALDNSKAVVTALAKEADPLEVTEVYASISNADAKFVVKEIKKAAKVFEKKDFEAVLYLDTAMKLDDWFVLIDADADDVTWTSSNNLIATVVDGKITGVSAGTATITGKAPVVKNGVMSWVTIEITVLVSDAST